MFPKNNIHTTFENIWRGGLPDVQQKDGEQLSLASISIPIRKLMLGETARREKIRALLHEKGISSMEDIQNLFKETIVEFMGNGLEAELEDELGYSKYDYRNENTDNSRNGYSSKKLQTSFGDVDVAVPRDRKG